jgi:aryl-alcohol dehydrogenase-like predicted oxidoreductase
MEKRTFGRTSLDVSVLGFGGAPIGVLNTEQAQIETILNALLDQGVNVIDTAAGYLGSEEAIGKAVAHRRDEFVLVSKCGQASDHLDGEAWSAQVITQTVDRALRRLQTDHLDVMLLHTCDLETLKKGEALGALVDACGAGKIRYVGYSGDNAAAVYAAEHPDVAVIETSINICDQANIDTVLPKAVENGVGVIAKRPIANAAWKNLSDQPGFYATYAKTYTERLAKMGVSLSELGFEGEPDRGWPEIALRFTLSQPGVHTAIIGTTNPAHVEANIQAADNGPLPAETVELLRVAFRQAESASAESWGGLT